ncbi:MAG TPA: DUF6249 domain-containing protein [Verrucomicrobiae bacterium]|nr:DUF6249 domain-containing protein [Verrucomicrobiae bacterium]
MKTIAKTICLVALLLAVTISPLAAQTAESENTTNTNETSLAPQTPPKAEMPPAPHAQSQVHRNPHANYAGGPYFPPGPSWIEGTIAIVAIVTPFICIVAVGGLIFESRRRRNELLHQTIRAMIDKGVPIPPELLTPSKSQFAPPQSPLDDVFPPRRKSDLRTGLIMLALGFGLLIFFSAINMKIWPVGFIFMLLGGALLLVHKFEKKNEAKTEVAPK